jgi:hypothetical protein
MRERPNAAQARSLTLANGAIVKPTVLAILACTVQQSRKGFSARTPP